MEIHDQIEQNKKAEKLFEDIKKLVHDAIAKDGVHILLAWDVLRQELKLFEQSVREGMDECHKRKGKSKNGKN